MVVTTIRAILVRMPRRPFTIRRDNAHHTLESSQLDGRQFYTAKRRTKWVTANHTGLLAIIVFLVSVICVVTKLKVLDSDYRSDTLFPNSSDSGVKPTLTLQNVRLAIRCHLAELLCRTLLDTSLPEG